MTFTHTNVPSQRINHNYFWWFWAFLEKLIKAEHWIWGLLRFAGLILFLVGLVLMMYSVETTLNVAGSANQPFFNWLFSESGARAIYVPLGVVLLVLFIIGRYISDIYHLQSNRLGIFYVMTSFFSMFFPKLSVSGGKEDLKPGEKNLLSIIGGPGYISVEPGTVVLFENLTGPSNALSGTRRFFVPRFERIKEIIDLRDQTDEIEQTNAMTRDGIEIQVKNIRYGFRMIMGKPAGPGFERSPENPYPFSKQAVKNMTYNRSVGAEYVTSWKNAIRFVVDGEITDYISRQWFDRLTVPLYSDVDEDPRQVITNLLKSPGFRRRMKDVGAELLWCDAGYFDHPQGEITRLDAWGATMEGISNVVRSEGAAERDALQEKGRAEGQADILRSIIQTFGNINLSDNPKENLRSVFLARTAQVLEVISAQNVAARQDGSGKANPKNS